MVDPLEEDTVALLDEELVDLRDVESVLLPADDTAAPPDEDTFAPQIQETALLHVVERVSLQHAADLVATRHLHVDGTIRTGPNERPEAVVVVASDGNKKRVRRMGATATTERRAGDWSEDIDPNKNAADDLLDHPCAMEAEGLTRLRTTR